ncbi:MAG: HAMP domain-containing protein [Deltaproteobacteria bacterium]|nr:HAMP domain-containing protein [Deltaproteobacteria bacterium]
MRIKLAYKIFGAFLLTSLIIIVLMTGIMRYFAERHFTEYVNKVESETLSELAEKLGAAYSEHRGWDFLEEDPRAFRSIIRTVFSRDESDRPLRPPPSGDPGERFDGDRQPDMPPPPGHLQHRISQRISLFDDQMQVIAGEAASTDDHILKAITIEGKTIGLLGLKKRQQLSGPREKTFLREQSKAFLVIGGMVLFLAALVSFLLSRHLLKPVGQLTEGAHALASRKFDTRIKVSSGDELGQLADDFNTMAQTLEKYEHLRRQWLSDISHELRTPIAILRGEIEAILDGVHEMSRETLESIHAEVMLLGKLIGDLHELSIAETGELSIENEPVKILRVLEHTLRMFEPRFAQKAISIQFDPADDMDVTVMADSDRLAQVFSNILENTLRYTGSPGTIRIWQTISSGRLHVFMEDSKPGVSDEAIEHLFDRLYRTDPSRSRKNGGSGLGLAIAKSIVEMSGGKIRASHSSIGGVRIEIILPVKAEN